MQSAVRCYIIFIYIHRMDADLKKQYPQGM